jgi:chemotaxis signal transduction protein
MTNNRHPEALQKYQRQLNDALASAEEVSEAVIALRIDRQGWLLSLTDLAETSVCPPLSKTGLMPPGVVGIGNFRGKVHTVLSMPQLLDQQPGSNGQGWTTVLHSKYGISLALLWPEMVGLFSRSDFVNIDQKNPSFIKTTWKDKQSELWNELDMATFLREKIGHAHQGENV